MNSLYFACPACKVFVDAGDRWAVATLEEPGFVTSDHPVDIQTVLDAPLYWSPGTDSEVEWLTREVLPTVRQFLTLHREHSVLFAEAEHFAPVDDEFFLDWLQLGFLADPRPRYWVEYLTLRSWEEVCTFMDSQSPTSWWWRYFDNSIDLHAAARRRFEELLASQAAGA